MSDPLTTLMNNHIPIKTRFGDRDIIVRISFVESEEDLYLNTTSMGENFENLSKTSTHGFDKWKRVKKHTERITKVANRGKIPIYGNNSRHLDTF